MAGDELSLVIAIDGPSGSGKSTLSKRLAAAYGLAYLDTGATYRAATLWAQQRGITLTDETAVSTLLSDFPLQMGLDPGNSRVELAGEDVTETIRSAELSKVVSLVAVNLEVRAILRKLQQEIIASERAGGFSEGRGIVAEGRDITTVVAPDAEVRILLIAGEDERLARRTIERHGAADASTLDATRDEVHRRDAQDSTVSAFMQAASGVVTMDNSKFDPDQTFAAGVRIVTDLTGILPGVAS